MDTNRTLILLALAGLLAVAPRSYAQETDQTVHHHRGDEEQDPYLVPALIQAEKSIDLRDFITAENKLRHILSDDDQNYRAWFDLGYVYTATRRDADAIAGLSQGGRRQTGPVRGEPEPRHSAG